MALAMLRELRQSGFARKSELASDLKQLAFENESGQEFNAVVLDGPNIAFLGWHKTHAKDLSHLYDLESACEKLMSRAAIVTDGQYASFKDRDVGLCYMAEKISPKQLDRLAAKCHERGIIQSSKNGHAISIQKQQLRQPLSKRLPLRRADVMRRPEPRCIMSRTEMRMQL